MKIIVSYLTEEHLVGYIGEVEAIRINQFSKPPAEPVGDEARAVAICYADGCWDDLKYRYILNGKEEIKYFQKQVRGCIINSDIVDLDFLVTQSNFEFGEEKKKLSGEWNDDIPF